MKMKIKNIPEIRKMLVDRSIQHFMLAKLILRMEGSDFEQKELGGRQSHQIFEIFEIDCFRKTKNAANSFLIIQA